MQAVDATSIEDTGSDRNGSLSPTDQDAAPKKSDRVLSLGRRAKQKAREVFASDDQEHGTRPLGGLPGNAIDRVSSDPAFNPSLILSQSPPKPDKRDGTTLKTGLKSAAEAIAHPKRVIQEKATRSAAAKISGAQHPFLSGELDRDLVAAQDELDKAASRKSLEQSQTPAEGDSTGSNSREDAARQKVEEIEEQRAGLLVAWALGKHVDRVQIVQARTPRPLPREHFVERTFSGQEGRFQWQRWLGYQALYLTRGFTARYIDNFEELPCDVKDLSRIVERLVVVSDPWQAWLMSIRQVATWQDPKCTGKWFALYWVLWYTEHIAGFVYASIIYTVIRNKFYPASIEMLRDSIKRSADREASAQAWAEVVEKHGRKDWIEPLLDHIGPSVQLQLGDLADLLEVLVNFYRWRSPWKTMETLFFFACCLLITALTDMAFCMKVFWFLAGGWFFFCFPIASNYPQYRYLVDPTRWIFWDVPSHAEWGIDFLQKKAAKQQMEEGADRGQRVQSVATSEDEESNSSYETATDSSRRLELSSFNQSELFRFRAFQSISRGHLIISRGGIRFTSRGRPWYIPYDRLFEMCKLEPDSAVKAATFGFAGARLQFIGLHADESRITETVAVHRDRRDQIFNLVLGWSGLRWKPLLVEKPIAKGSISKEG